MDVMNGDEEVCLFCHTRKLRHDVPCTTCGDNTVGHRWTREEIALIQQHARDHAHETME